jgi:hypothetical protein
LFKERVGPADDAFEREAGRIADAVAWRNSKAPRFDGSAKTIPAATDAAWKKIGKRTDDLRNPKKPQKKK